MAGSPAPPPKALARVVLLTKDEGDLIGDFLAYYGYLFGPENLVVVDNGSTDPGVLAEYEAARVRGTTVVVDRRPFREAVRWMSEHVARAAVAGGGCEWVLPLETDEFLFEMDPGAPGALGALGATSGASPAVAGPTRREAVEAAFRMVPEDVTVLRYGAFLGSSVDPADAAYVAGGYRYGRPAAELTRFHDQGWDKLAVRSDAFVAMTQWCHHARVRRGREGKSPRLGLLHFHDAGVRRSVQRAAPVVQSYGYVDVAHGTLGERLAQAEALRGKPIACGHKVEQYGDHLRRRATLEAFRRHLGRLPASVEEMAAYAASGAAVDAAVRRDLATGRLARAVPAPAVNGAASLTWDALLYHEPRMEHAFSVAAVAARLLMLLLPQGDARDARAAEATGDAAVALEEVPGPLLPGTSDRSDPLSVLLVATSEADVAAAARAASEVLERPLGHVEVLVDDFADPGAVARMPRTVGCPPVPVHVLRFSPGRLGDTMRFLRRDAYDVVCPCICLSSGRATPDDSGVLLLAEALHPIVAEAGGVFAVHAAREGDEPILPLQATLMERTGLRRSGSAPWGADTAPRLFAFEKD